MGDLLCNVHFDYYISIFFFLCMFLRSPLNRLG